MNFFKTLFATLIGSILGFFILFLILIGIVAGLSTSLSKDDVTVKENSILVIDLSQAIPERSSNNPLSGLSPLGMGNENATGLDDILLAINEATTDDNIKGILIETSYSPNSYATLAEVREALIQFKESGKFIYAFAEMMEEHAYYLASVATKIYLHPTGDMLFKGNSYTVTYLKGLLDKLGVEAQLIRHGKYKSAGEPLIADRMSDANREQILSFTSSIYNAYMSQIASSRKINDSTLLMIAAQLKVQTADDAVTYGLIDSLKYKDELETELKELMGIEQKKDLNYISMSDYASTISTVNTETKNKIAVIYATGEIVSGESDDETMGSESMVKALVKARKDSSVKAVVLRINSPGGSALASDVIWREVVLTKQTKPVIVSMGAVAASGGYYIAAPADVIVAEPTTITGSIGVFGVIPNAQKLLNEKMGVKFEKVTIGEFADIGSFDRPLKPAETAIIQNMIDRIYTNFIKCVATGRNLTVEQVDAIAQGRVWSGKDALSIGLVDTLGGIKTALAIAAERANIESYKTLSLPYQKDPIEQLMKNFKTSTQTHALKNELGEFYPVYIQLKHVLNYRGVQARLPFDVN